MLDTGICVWRSDKQMESNFDAHEIMSRIVDEMGNLSNPKSMPKIEKQRRRNLGNVKEIRRETECSLWDGRLAGFGGHSTVFVGTFDHRFMVDKPIVRPKSTPSDRA